MTRRRLGDYPVVEEELASGLGDLGNHESADLTLFMPCSHAPAMADLIAAFRATRPTVHRVFYEALPSLLMSRQVMSGGAYFRDLLLTGSPDVFANTSERIMATLMEQKRISGYSVYLHDRLVLMVKEGNPLGLRGLEDLVRDEVRVSQPGGSEEISLTVSEMYLKAGGDAFLSRVIEDKRAEGTTLLSMDYRKETPLRIARGTAEVGPAWASDVATAQLRGMPVAALDLPEDLDQRFRSNYYIAKLYGTANPDNAVAFLNFIKTESAQEVFKRYGFVPHYA